MPRPKVKASASARGLGYDHQQRRKALLPAALGTACPGPAFGPRARRCTGLMTCPSRMDLDHSTPRALGGTTGDRIICSSCNRSSGARLGNALRAGKRIRTREGSRVPSRRSREW